MNLIEFLSEIKNKHSYSTKYFICSPWELSMIGKQRTSNQRIKVLWLLFMLDFVLRSLGTIGTFVPLPRPSPMLVQVLLFTKYSWRQNSLEDSLKLPGCFSTGPILFSGLQSGHVQALGFACTIEQNRKTLSCFQALSNSKKYIFH
jgi:hypothetical protein